jgi:hypothetical protein
VINVDERKNNISINKKLARLGILIGAIMVASVAAYTLKPFDPKPLDPQPSFVVPASIEDIYPIFLCPCCGNPLDPNAICCGLAKERIDYISALSDAGIAHEEIVLVTAKKYGVDSIINESLREEVKEEIRRRAPKERPQIAVTPEVYDIGEVSVAGGEVTITIMVKNEGQSDLVIDNIETSCMCTTTILAIKDDMSPLYGMNMNDGKHPTGWSGTIHPGEEAVLHVKYDPSMHGDFRGPLTRTITIYSNDPIEFKKDVRIEANQIE